MSKQEESRSISRLEILLICVALALLAAILIYTAITQATSYPDKVVYVVSTEVSDQPTPSTVNLNASESQTASVPDAPININTASLEELMTLPGIGEVRAAAIIEYRETYGDFISLRELMEVSGIGEKIFENVKDLITIS